MNETLFDAYKMYEKDGNYQKAWDCLAAWYRSGDSLAYPVICSFRDSINADMRLMERYRDIVRQSYDLTGVDHFDDFMIAIEWDRALSEKFWLPRRSKLMNICNALQDLENDALDELFISQPPRTGKSTIVLFFTLWVTLRNSERSNLYVSYTDSVVSVFYNGLIEMLNDKDTYRWQNIFPNSTIASTNSRDNLLNLDRKKRYASVTCRSLYGTLNGACDCNGYIIGDDLVSGIEEAMNSDRLNAVWYKCDNNMLPRAKQNAKRLWIGTRWSIYDPINRRLNMLQNDRRFDSVRYSVINIPALNENDESNFDYACGVGFDTNYYLQRRASFENGNDLASWEAQYQGSPIERNGAVFDPQELRYFNGVLPSDVEPDRIFFVVDPAWGGGDFVSGLILYQYGEDLYLKDVVYDNGDKRKTIPKLVSKIVINHCQTGKVEATKTTNGYAEQLDTELRKKGHRVNMVANTKHWGTEGKRQRIFNKSAEIKEQIIFLAPNYRDKEYSEAMRSLFLFTMEGKIKHDDFPDSLAMAISFTNTTASVLEIKNRSW